MGFYFLSMNKNKKIFLYALLKSMQEFNSRIISRKFNKNIISNKENI